MPHINQEIIGLIRIIDGVQNTNNNNNHHEQRMIEFPQLNFSRVTSEQLLDSALTTLHPELSNNNNNNKNIKWIFPPSLCCQSGNDNINSSEFGSTLPPKASLLSCGLTPSSTIASEVYLIGQYHEINNNNNNITTLSSEFVPTKVLVTLWNVKDHPSYEIDLCRPLSEITVSKFRRVIEKFSKIPAKEMSIEVDVDGKSFTSFPPLLTNNDHTGVVGSANNAVVLDETKKKIFPFVFDPSVIPKVRISNHVHHSQGSSGSSYFLQSHQLDEPRIEAEYGRNLTNTNTPIVVSSSSSQNQNQQQQLYQVVPPEKSKDNWEAWLAARKQARDVHVRGLLTPSSKEQLEIERALQVTSIDDVRRVTQNISNIMELASSSQLLHQQLENVRTEIMRDRLGDTSFAKIEGERSLLFSNNGSAVKTSVQTDGVDHEPMVVNLR